jgi:hypothetical protein
MVNRTAQRRNVNFAWTIAVNRLVNIRAEVVVADPEVSAMLSSDFTRDVLNGASGNSGKNSINRLNPTEEIFFEEQQRQSCCFYNDESGCSFVSMG